MTEHRNARPLALEATDGHAWTLPATVPPSPCAALLWLPALGVAARHYQPLADALAAHGVAVFLHEWRGHGSSNVRAGRNRDWGYRELLTLDLPASEAAMAAAVPPGTPFILGGHSLGGQLATCRLAIAPSAASRLWLVGSGAPYWRAFPPPARYALPLAYRALRALAHAAGALPGRSIGFGGREARGVISDWAESALGGHYAARGLDVDIEQRMRQLKVDVSAVRLARDWYAPESSLRFLLSKMPDAPADVACLDDTDLGVPGDHFQWMRAPHAVAARLARSLDAAARPG